MKRLTPAVAVLALAASLGFGAAVLSPAAAQCAPGVQCGPDTPTPEPTPDPRVAALERQVAGLEGRLAQTTDLLSSERAAAMKEAVRTMRASAKADDCKAAAKVGLREAKKKHPSVKKVRTAYAACTAKH